MICGIIMLSAIAYVTLSTEQRPFGLVNKHLSPALGWAWLIATVMANIVWCMPQFNLARAAVQQNLLPSIGDSTTSTVIICAILLVVAFGVNMLYESEGKGRKLFDLIIKVMVGLIVISFIAVVGTLATSGSIDFGAIFSGFIPTQLCYSSHRQHTLRLLKIPAKLTGGLQRLLMISVISSSPHSEPLLALI